MFYSKADIVRDVRVAIDQNASVADLTKWEDVDTLTLSEIVESKIGDAAQIVFSIAPLAMFDEFSKVPTEDGKHEQVYNGDSTYAYVVTLPDDFLLLASLRMSDWARAVAGTETVREEDAAYQLQYSRWEGLRGSTEKPVVAIVHEGGKLVAKAFSTASSSTCEAYYVKQPCLYKKTADEETGETTEGIDIPKRLYRSVVYATAYFVALAHDDSNLALAAWQTAQTLSGATASQPINNNGEQ